MILKGKEAKGKLLSGINKTADLVKITMGAKGSTVLIKDSLGFDSHITKDGVTVAQSVILADDVEQEGANLVKTASKKTVDEAGDSTTTTAVLTQSFCNGVMKYLEIGYDSNELKEQLISDLAVIKKQLKEFSKDITTTDEIRNIAMVSSNGDMEVSDIIKTIYDEMGNDVVIDVRKGDSVGTKFDKLKGFILPNSGYGNVVFVNNFDKGVVEYQNPKIYVVNQNIKQFNESISHLIQSHVIEGCVEPVVLVTNYVDDIPMRLIINSIQDGRLANFAIVVSNLLGDSREERFKDLCAFTNAEYSDNLVMSAGTCDKILISKDTVTVINGAGNVDGRIKDLKDKIANYAGKNVEYENRLLSLNTNASLIHVGGKLANSIKERVDRVEDAVLSVKSAISEGYCAGGGITLLAISENKKLNRISQEALKSCYIQILRNANKEPFRYYDRLLENGNLGVLGYDVLSDKVVDMKKEGIIDSTKSIRVSVENAIDTAITFMSINAVVSIER